MKNRHEISIPDKISGITNAIVQSPSAETRENLIFLVNELIKTDFSSLVQLLYRVDIDEKNLKQLLKEQAEVDAASIIADLVIKRQLQKITSKMQFNTKEKPGSAESW